MKSSVITLLSIIFAIQTLCGAKTYVNPVIDVNLPDPTVLRDNDGTYYMTGTENIPNLGLYSSRDLVNWTLTGTIFRKDDKRPATMIWAPELCRINGKYVLFYCSNPDASDTFQAYIGYAVADSIAGPWHDRGKLFDGYEAGCRDTIDPFYFFDRGKHYLFWGSTNNMWVMEIGVNDDIDITYDLSAKVQTAGKAVEGTEVYKRGDWYYMFASRGSYAWITYQVVVGRSKNVAGPYVTREGIPFLSGGDLKSPELNLAKAAALTSGNERFTGTGHNAPVITDGAGDTWFICHGHHKGKELDLVRVPLLDRLLWDDEGWPYLEGGTPTPDEHAAPVFPGITLPPYLSDDMMVQRNDTLPVEGITDNRLAPVRVRCSWGAEAVGMPDARGRFSVAVPTPGAGGPHSVTVAQDGEKPVIIKNILSGEVWFCSGQSNMEMPVGKWGWGKLWDSAEETAAADHPEIRLFQVPRKTAAAPVSATDFASAGWQRCNPATVASFSALAYFFARGLSEELGVPVGVINSSWGGTYIEGWTRREALPEGTDRGLHTNGLYNSPSAFYNAMVRPLESFPVRGVLWYQGEQNASRHSTYRASLEAMIADWRRGRGREMPFYIVQLAGYGCQDDVQPDSHWAALRQAQAEALHMPSTGLVTAIDLGDPSDIHPPRKKELAARLVSLALTDTYGLESWHPAPYPVNAVPTESGMTIEFSADLCPDRLPVEGFILEAADGTFHKAKAVMTAYRRIELSAENISFPASARYDWGDCPRGNLRGKDGMPVVPFRTDSLIENLKNVNL